MTPRDMRRIPVQGGRAILVLCAVRKTGKLEVLGFPEGAGHCGLGGIHDSNPFSCEEMNESAGLGGRKQRERERGGIKAPRPDDDRSVNSACSPLRGGITSERTCCQFRCCDLRVFPDPVVEVGNDQSVIV